MSARPAEQVFQPFSVIASPAAKFNGATVRMGVEAASAAGVGASWRRNATCEPLDDADIEGGMEEKAKKGKPWRIRKAEELITSRHRRTCRPGRLH